MMPTYLGFIYSMSCFNLTFQLQALCNFLLEFKLCLSNFMLCLQFVILRFLKHYTTKDFSLFLIYILDKPFTNFPPSLCVPVCLFAYNKMPKPNRRTNDAVAAGSSSSSLAPSLSSEWYLTTSSRWAFHLKPAKSTKNNSQEEAPKATVENKT